MSNEKVFKEDSQNWYARGYFNVLKTAGWVDINLKKALKPYGITHGGWALELIGLFLFGSIALFFTGAGKIALSTKSQWD